MPRTSLTIPAPCAASWDAMTPTAAGRHCAACRTEVVDFTQKSPAEILAYLHQANGRPVCGRVSARQVAPVVAAGPRWRQWAGTLLTVSGFSALLLPKLAFGASLAVTSPVDRRVPTSAVPMQMAPGLPKRLSKRLAASNLIIRGIVLDARTCIPAPGVTILLQGTHWGTSTDKDGQFALTVVPKGQHVELVVAFIGYKRLVKKLTVAECKAPITILLEADDVILGLLSTPAHPRS